MITISICMIVKNEAGCLHRAIANWRELADELIVVDTGSTDGTQNIAEYYGARVLHYGWEYPGNYGEARNVSLDAATGDWIVVLDADEIIQDPQGLRNTLLDQEIPVTGLEVNFQNYNAAGEVVMTWTQMRIFRRGMYRYKHRAHEVPISILGATDFAIISTVFEHRPPEGREREKIEPLLDALLLDCEEHPNDPHPLYFAHRQYVLAGEYDKAIAFGERFLSIPGDHDRCECYGNLAHCYMQEKLRGYGDPMLTPSACHTTEAAYLVDSVG